MATLAAVAAYAAIASAAVGAYTAVEAGNEKADEAKLAEKQYQDQADIARVQGEQQEADRRQKLAETLATQDAIRAGRGVELDSGSGANLRETSTVAAARDIDTIKANALNQQRSFGLNAAGASAQASAATLSGIGGATTSLLSGAKALPALSSKATA